MELFFDTETTGVPRNYNAPVSDVENWPRLVQLGYMVIENGVCIHEAEYIVKPDGFEIPLRASSVHGVTTEKALAEGAPIIDVLDEFTTWVDKCNAVIGHNVSFDINVIGAEFFRMYGKSPLEGKTTICTMKAATEFCQLPGPYGYKWPKLGELYRKLFDEDMGAAHTALQDISNTVKCYSAMIERGVISTS
jgi:DNA polymerase III subunit epsilon